MYLEADRKLYIFEILEEKPVKVESDTLNIIPPETYEERLFVKEQEFTGGFTSSKLKFSSNGRYVALYKNLQFVGTFFSPAFSKIPYFFKVSEVV